MATKKKKKRGPNLQPSKPKEPVVLYRVCDENGHPVYQGKGVAKAEAERLASGLQTLAHIEEVSKPL
jgi:hypothetical protein